jgi:hypothetical protein
MLVSMATVDASWVDIQKLLLIHIKPLPGGGAGADDDIESIGDEGGGSGGGGSGL